MVSIVSTRFIAVISSILMVGCQALAHVTFGATRAIRVAMWPCQWIGFWVRAREAALNITANRWRNCENGGEVPARYKRVLWTLLGNYNRFLVRVWLIKEKTDLE